MLQIPAGVGGVGAWTAVLGPPPPAAQAAQTPRGVVSVPGGQNKTTGGERNGLVGVTKRHALPGRIAIKEKDALEELTKLSRISTALWGVYRLIPFAGGHGHLLYVSPEIRADPQIRRGWSYTFGDLTLFGKKAGKDGDLLPSPRRLLPPVRARAIWRARLPPLPWAVPAPFSDVEPAAFSAWPPFAEAVLASAVQDQ